MLKWEIAPGGNVAGITSEAVNAMQEITLPQTRWYQVEKRTVLGMY
jgi:hypothetical protein